MIAMHHFSQIRCIEGTGNALYFAFSTQGGYLGVAIFFFLSGYGLMKSEQQRHLSPFSFLKRRLIKTYIPAVVVSIIWAVYMLFAFAKPIDINLLRGVVWNFNDEVLWFVRAIICLYILFLVYCHISRFKIISLITLGIIAVWCTDVGLVHGASIFMFFGGVSIAEHGHVWWSFMHKWATIVAAFICIALFCVLFERDALVLHLLFDVSFIFIFVASMSYFHVRITGLPRCISSCSYDIYLVHNKALIILRSFGAIIPLWQFAGLSFLFTIVFYNLRKFLKL